MPARRLSRWKLWLLLVVALTFAPRPVAAEEPPAERLFQQGKLLLAKRAYTEACPLLAESHRLEPKTGTLLALGICLEGEGKLASARAAYLVVAERAEREGRADRVKVARERVVRLDVEVSTLLVLPPNVVDGKSLALELDGVAVARETWERPMPIDGGEHFVRVTGLAGPALEATMRVAARGEHRVLQITAPTLPPVVTEVPINPKRPSDSRSVGTAREPSRERPATPYPSPASTTPPSLPHLVAAGALGAGVALIGVGTYFTVRAIEKNEASNPDCPNDVCSPEGQRDRDDAQFAGNVATATLVTGGVLTAAGGGFLLYSSFSSRDRGARTAIGAGLSLGRAGFGASLAGTF